jgi:hypothetical protein
MDSLTAFAFGQAHRNDPARVFDWDRAAALIREREPREASAGLGGDWEWTGGSIWRDGAPVPRDETYTYLSSTWATPELDLDGEVIDCWVWRDGSGWDSDTYWPDSALAILAGGTS